MATSPYLLLTVTGSENHAKRYCGAYTYGDTALFLFAYIGLVNQALGDEVDSDKVHSSVTEALLRDRTGPSNC